MDNELIEPNRFYRTREDGIAWIGSFIPQEMELDQKYIGYAFCLKGPYCGRWVLKEWYRSGRISWNNRNCRNDIVEKLSQKKSDEALREIKESKRYRLNHLCTLLS